ncbi:MAG: peptidoglycan recognition protein family protein [Actinomycetota bacterium]
MITRRRFLGRLGALLVVALFPARALAKPRRVELICRRAWGALKPTGEFKRHKVKRMTVHHSAVLLTDNSDAPAHFRSHQRGHQDRGWPDIAYHALVDRHGNVYEGRPMWAVPDTATNYDPTGHFTVMCEGNFQEQKPSRAQVAALVDVLAWASAEFDVAPRTIAGHQDHADTACPGAKLESLITAGEIRRRVKERLATGGVELVEICGKEGKARVADIEAGTD